MPAYYDGVKYVEYEEEEGGGNGSSNKKTKKCPHCNGTGSTFYNCCGSTMSATGTGNDIATCCQCGGSGKVPAT